MVPTEWVSRLKCIACAIATTTAIACSPHRAETDRAPQIADTHPDSEFGQLVPPPTGIRLQRGNEARDQQKMFLFVPTSRGAEMIKRNNGYFGKLVADAGDPLFTLWKSTNDSDVAPVDEVNEIKKATLENNPPYGLLVATMILKIDVAHRDRTNLPTTEMVDLFLSYSRAQTPKWKAYSKKRGSNTYDPLYVRRLVYPKSDGTLLTDVEAFPSTARWDWDENSAMKLVVGIPCDGAWCLIGADTPYSGDENDPEDAGRAASVKWRVRGWFDRKPAEDPLSVGDSYFHYIFPADDLDRVVDDQFRSRTAHFWKHPRLVATIVTADHRYHELRIFNTKGASWTGKVDEIDANIDRRATPPEYRMPAAARWGSKSARGGGGGGRVGGKGAEFEFGDVWMRCANGCCTGEF